MRGLNSGLGLTPGNADLLSQYSVGGNRPVQVLDATGGNIRALRAPLTFARSGVADYLDADLAFQQAAAGVPRVMHDPAGVLPPRLAVEASETRINPNAEDMAGNGGFRVSSADGDAAPFGAGTSFSLFEVSTASVSGSCASTQPYTLAAGDHTVAVYAKAGPDQTGWLLSRISAQADFTDAARAWFDPAAGVKGAASLASGASALTGVVSWIEPQGAGVYRCFTRFTLAAPTDVFVRHYIADADSTLVSTLADQVQLWGEQLVTGSTTGSFIRGNTPNITRAAESAIIPFLPANDFTVGFDFSVSRIPTNFERVFEIYPDAASGNNRQAFFFDGSGNLRFETYSGGAARGAIGNLGAVSAGRHRVIWRVQDGAMGASLDGGAVVSVTGLTGTLPACDRWRLFDSSGGTGAPRGENGAFLAVAWAQGLLDADMQSWSALP